MVKALFANAVGTLNGMKGQIPSAQVAVCSIVSLPLSFLTKVSCLFAFPPLCVSMMFVLYVCFVVVVVVVVVVVDLFLL